MFSTFNMSKDVQPKTNLLDSILEDVKTMREESKKAHIAPPPTTQSRNPLLAEIQKRMKGPVSKPNLKYPTRLPKIAPNPTIKPFELTNFDRRPLFEEAESKIIEFLKSKNEVEARIRSYHNGKYTAGVGASEFFRLKSVLHEILPNTHTVDTVELYNLGNEGTLRKIISDGGKVKYEKKETGQDAVVFDDVWGVKVSSSKETTLKPSNAKTFESKVTPTIRNRERWSYTDAKLKAVYDLTIVTVNDRLTYEVEIERVDNSTKFSKFRDAVDYILKLLVPIYAQPISQSEIKTTMKNHNLLFWDEIEKKKFDAENQLTFSFNFSKPYALYKNYWNKPVDLKLDNLMGYEKSKNGSEPIRGWNSIYWYATPKVDGERTSLYFSGTGIYLIFPMSGRLFKVGDPQKEYINTLVDCELYDKTSTLLAFDILFYLGDDVRRLDFKDRLQKLDSLTNLTFYRLDFSIKNFFGIQQTVDYTAITLDSVKRDIIDELNIDFNSMSVEDLEKLIHSKNLKTVKTINVHDLFDQYVANLKMVGLRRLITDNYDESKLSQKTKGLLTSTKGFSKEEFVKIKKIDEFSKLKKNAKLPPNAILQVVQILDNKVTLQKVVADIFKDDYKLKEEYLVDEFEQDTHRNYIQALEDDRSENLKILATANNVATLINFRKNMIKNRKYEDIPKELVALRIETYGIDATLKLLGINISEFEEEVMNNLSSDEDNSIKKLRSRIKKEKNVHLKQILNRDLQYNLGNLKIQYLLNSTDDYVTLLKLIDKSIITELEDLSSDESKREQRKTIEKIEDIKIRSYSDEDSLTDEIVKTRLKTFLKSPVGKKMIRETFNTTKISKLIKNKPKVVLQALDDMELRILEDDLDELTQNFRSRWEQAKTDRMYEGINNAFRWMRSNKQFDYDGIILQPSVGYYNRWTYKWKPSNQISIDFKLRKVSDTEYVPMVKSRKGLVEFRKSGYDTIVTSNKQYHNIVVECLWKGDHFEALRPRYDRDSPNALDVANEVWKSIIHPVRKETLRGQGAQLFRRYHNFYKDRMIKQIPAGSSILDVGSGRGGDLSKWDSAKLGEVYAVEPSKENISELKNRIKSSKLHTNVEIINAGAQDTSKILENVEKGTLDAVVSFFSMQFFYKSEDMLDEFVDTINSVLKPGGQFVGIVMDAGEGSPLGKMIDDQAGGVVHIENSAFSLDYDPAKSSEEFPFGQEIRIEIKDPDSMVHYNEYLCYFCNNVEHKCAPRATHNLIINKLFKKGIKLIDYAVDIEIEETPDVLEESGENTNDQPTYEVQFKEQIMKSEYTLATVSRSTSGFTTSNRLPKDARHLASLYRWFMFEKKELVQEPLVPTFEVLVDRCTKGRVHCKTTEILKNTPLQAIPFDRIPTVKGMSLFRGYSGDIVTPPEYSLVSFLHNECDPSHLLSNVLFLTDEDYRVSTEKSKLIRKFRKQLVSELTLKKYQKLMNGDLAKHFQQKWISLPTTKVRDPNIAMVEGWKLYKAYLKDCSKSLEEYAIPWISQVIGKNILVVNSDGNPVTTLQHWDGLYKFPKTLMILKIGHTFEYLVLVYKKKGEVNVVYEFETKSAVIKRLIALSQ